jgi:hypothetical protein
MSHRSVYCVVSTHARASRILQGLGDLDFPLDNISALFLEVGPERIAKAKTKPAAKNSGKDKGAAASFPELGKLPDTQSLTLAAGRLIAAGPVTAILSDITAYGISGGLLEFGVPGSEAQRYEARIKAGEVFLSIRTENPDKSDRARTLFAAEGAEDIRTLMDVLTPKLSRRASYGMPGQPVLSSR